MRGSEGDRRGVIGGAAWAREDSLLSTSAQIRLNYHHNNSVLSCQPDSLCVGGLAHTYYAK